MDFFEVPADCNLFRLCDKYMTAELRRGGHSHPNGLLSPRDLSRARAIFAHRDVFVVGMIVVRYHAAAKVANFYRLWVEPAARKNGVGQALMKFAQRRVAELGGRTIEFKTGLDLASAVALYKKLGYREKPCPEAGPLGLSFQKSLRR